MLSAMLFPLLCVLCLCVFVSARPTIRRPDFPLPDVRDIPQLPCMTRTAQVETDKGPVIGCVDDIMDAENPVAVFGNIPFGADTGGDNRWKPPQPVAPWTKPLKTTHVYGKCPQANANMSRWGGTEDCLNLDIYVPAKAVGDTDAKLPVMIFIYGGGLSDGSKYLDGIYDGRNSARNQNHVLVTFNYRVGALGWLALAELQDESKDASLGNYGLMDQRAAFQWVQTNIANFGGDPDNVMIFGQSAGAMSVCSHMVSEASNGLFKHALMESGNCDSDVFYFKPNQNIKWGQAKVNASGCVPGSKNVLECMRKIPQGLVMNDELMYPAFTQSGCPPGWPVFTWGFTIDGSKVGLKDKPNALMKQGKINSGVESLVAGTNDNEGSLFLMELPNLVPPPHDNPPDEVAYDMMIQRFFGSNEANVKQIESMYDLDTYGTYAEALGVMIKHWFFACSTRRVVRYASDAGIKTFEYHFVYHNEWWDIEILGDYHSAELAFVLENPWPIGAHHFNKNDTNVASLLGGYWANLAASGNPNKPGNSTLQIHWPQYSTDSDEHMALSENPKVITALFQEECDIWDTITPQ